MVQLIKEILKEKGIQGKIEKIFNGENKLQFYIIIDNGDFIHPVYFLDLIKKELFESGISKIDLFNNYKEIKL